VCEKDDRTPRSVGHSRTSPEPGRSLEIGGENHSSRVRSGRLELCDQGAVDPGPPGSNRLFLAWRLDCAGRHAGCEGRGLQELEELAGVDPLTGSGRLVELSVGAGLAVQPLHLR